MRRNHLGIRLPTSKSYPLSAYDNGSRAFNVYPIHGPGTRLNTATFGPDPDDFKYIDSVEILTISLGEACTTIVLKNQKRQAEHKWRADLRPARVTGHASRAVKHAPLLASHENSMCHACGPRLEVWDRAVGRGSFPEICLLAQAMCIGTIPPWTRLTGRGF